MKLPSIREMFEAGMHFGHSTRNWNPKMAQFIHGSREKIHIIDLDITAGYLREAVAVVSGIAQNGGKLLFVGTKRSARIVVKEEATRCQMPYVDFRWLGGMLTNYKTVRQSIKRLRNLESDLASGAYRGLSKKEKLGIRREIAKLRRSLGGIKEMGSLPDALFVVDVKQEAIAVREAKRLGIPVIGMVDTNSCPDEIDYLIPGNDDSSKSIKLVAAAFADAILAVKANADKKKHGEVTEVEAAMEKDTGSGTSAA